MTTVLLAMGLIGIFFVLMSVRLIFIKDGKFKGTCASQSPYLNKSGEACGFCGKMPEHCENKSNDDQMGEVEKVMSKY